MKDFDVWNEIKKQVESHPRFEFNEGELWWCDIGLNIGSEQDGPSPLFERPVLVGKKFSNETFLAFPLTSNSKSGAYYYKLDEGSNIVLCQPRLIDARRLKRKIRRISHRQRKEILAQFKSLL